MIGKTSSTRKRVDHVINLGFRALIHSLARQARVMAPLLAAPIVIVTSALPADADSTTEVTAAEVQKLIGQLGSDSYATRVRARSRLQHMGLEAFDELLAAQNHTDIEVEMASRYLVSSLMVSWAKDTDPEPFAACCMSMAVNRKSNVAAGSYVWLKWILRTVSRPWCV